MRSAFLFSVLLFLSFDAFSFQESQNFARFGASEPSLQALLPTFKILSWNLHKGENPGLFADFKNLAQNADIVMFQEAVENTDFIAGLVQAAPTYQWTLARSFFSKRESDFHGYTGVSTGSAVARVQETVLISEVTEPFSHTPKTAIVTEYKVEGSSQNLLVVNVHAINFVLEGTFVEHMQQVANAIQGHNGPIVMAGDFNTWSEGRISTLKKIMGGLGLLRVPIENYYFIPFIKPYDHVFVRGLSVRHAEALEKIETSDHMPLAVELEVIPSLMEPILKTLRDLQIKPNEKPVEPPLKVIEFR